MLATSKFHGHCFVNIEFGVGIARTIWFLLWVFNFLDEVDRDLRQGFLNLLMQSLNLIRCNVFDSQ